MTVVHYCRKTTDHLDQEIETEITGGEIPGTTIGTTGTIETTETIETIVIVSIYHAVVVLTLEIVHMSRSKYNNPRNPNFIIESYLHCSNLIAIYPVCSKMIMYLRFRLSR